MALVNVSSVQVEVMSGGFESNRIRDLYRGSPFTGDSPENDVLNTDLYHTGHDAANLGARAAGQLIRS